METNDEVGRACRDAVGALTVIVWEQVKAFDPVYEIIPGFIVCTVVIIAVSLMTKKPRAEIEKEFETAVEQLKG